MKVETASRPPVAVNRRSVAPSHSGRAEKARSAPADQFVTHAPAGAASPSSVPAARRFQARLHQVEASNNYSRALLHVQTENLTKLEALRTEWSKNPGFLSDAQADSLQRQLLATRKVIKNHLASMERDSKVLLTALGNPDIQRELTHLPPEELGDTLARTFAATAGTSAQSAFVSKELIPSLQKDTHKPLWKALWDDGVALGKDVGALSKTRGSLKGAAVKFLGTLAPEIAAQNPMLAKTVFRKALGLNAGEAAELEKAFEHLADAKTSPAGVVQKLKDKLGKFGVVLEPESLKKLAVVGAAFGLYGNIQNALKKGANADTLSRVLQGTNNLTTAAGSLLKTAPRIGKFMGMLEAVGGKVAAPIGAVVSYFDLQASANKGSMKDTVWDSLSFSGGVIATGGLVFPPLILVGGVTSGVGFLGKTFFGESEMEALRREML